MLLEQFAGDFPQFCKVGTGYNKRIDLDANGFIAIVDSVLLLQHLNFEGIFVDEAHHPAPLHMPFGRDVFKFSATHRDQADFKYTMGQAIEDGVLCDYDLTVPVINQDHPYVSLARLLLSQAGRFRRVLAYCNSVREARRFQQVLNSVGLAAWHMNSQTALSKRREVLRQFVGNLHKPAHILVTVQVLGEGVNLPNADTCMFVEPRNSYVSIVQALGRVLRKSAAKPLAHIVLPAVAQARTASSTLEWQQASNAKDEPVGFDQAVRHPEPHEATPSQEHAADNSKHYDKRDSRNRDAPEVLAMPGGSAMDQRRRLRPAQPEVVQSDKEGYYLGQSDRSNSDVACQSPPVASSSRSDEWPVQRRCIQTATNLQAKTGTVSFVSTDYDTQLERFINVISRADLRLQHQAIRFRVSIVDVTDTCKGDLRAISRDVLSKLSDVILYIDPWTVRLQALQRFISKHDRMPRRRSQVYDERSLGHFLHNAGCRLKKGILAPDRVRLLQNSSYALLNHRFQQWHDKSWYFKERCAALSRCVANNNELPSARDLSRSAARLGKWLAGIGSANVRITNDRLQTLQAAHPLVAERVEGWARSQYKMWQTPRWRQKLAATKEFVCRSGRLPRGSGNERVLQRWLHKQKLVFFSLSEVFPEVKKELLVHPILDAYFHL